jgi:hypothetical protein
LRFYGASSFLKGGQGAGYAPFIINTAFVLIAVCGKTSPA